MFTNNLKTEYFIGPVRRFGSPEDLHLLKNLRRTLYFQNVTFFPCLGYYVEPIKRVFILKTFFSKLRTVNHPNLFKEPLKNVVVKSYEWNKMMREIDDYNASFFMLQVSLEYSRFCRKPYNTMFSDQKGF